MKENWFALFLCINKEISVEKALIKMGIQKKSKTYGKHDSNEISRIAKLKDSGKSYTEIGKMFGMNRSQVASIEDNIE